MNVSQNKLNSPFSVDWTHRLRFTTDSFQNDSVLTSVIQELNPVKVLPVIDHGLSIANDSLVQHVTDWSETLSFEIVSPLIIPSGESAKNDFQVVDAVLEAINSNKLCRKSCVLIIGGGAVLDAVGFAASIAHRGIPVIRMPTTTLSACDSGLGVKNGVNYFGKKNFVGVFDPPYAVVNDFELLTTLDDRHWRSGFSEAVKVSLIKDPPLFDEIESNAALLVDRNIEATTEILKQSAILHLQHITEGGDPFECLEARPLDFGHWSAHKLEQLTSNELSHGEAVSIGLAIDIQCSVILGLLEKSSADRILKLLQNLNLPIWHESLKNPNLLKGIEEFREHLGGKLTLLMLKDIGDTTNIHSLDEKVVLQAIQNLM